MKRALFLLLCQLLSASPVGVTYEFSGGRFGDNVLTYLHAKWVSYKYNLPLIYKPFPYSSDLVMDDQEIHYSRDLHAFAPKHTLRNDLDRINPRLPFLYVCPYFPETPWELNRQIYFRFPVDWGDPAFRAAARQTIAPKRPLHLITPPEGVVSIAMHIREGGGYDDEEHKLKDPLKSPPLSFYIQCLQKVLDIFESGPIYCHIFTDALDPRSWVDKLRESAPPDRVTFNYRKENNRHDANVLEDFFSLFNFDILIRPESNFSIVAGLIHNYAMVCSPTAFSIHDRVATIDEIKVDFDTERLITQYTKRSP
ncbi:MAG TPA: hypothetical protein VLF94_09075 [Chlamydiales bacterium]|nr:hypothetical protein [Chlamydiales bacterium]